jgi:hypothetical protein
LAFLSWTVSAAHPGVAPDVPVRAQAPPQLTLEGVDAEARRTALVRRAQVRLPDGFQPPALDSGSTGGTIECRYLAKQADGTSAKFDCVLADGRFIKVKYGRNPEIHAETLATALLTTLGYPADRVAIVPRVRCYGCPRYPFATMQILQLVNAAGVLEPHGFERGYTDFTWVAVEHRFPAPAIETSTHTGWAWFELRDSNAPSADIGALRLLAVFLAHWDNKSDNQRLVCLDADRPADAGAADCAHPLAMVQDLGSTFGPTKLNVASWTAHAVWKDRARCLVTMRHLPYRGGTFAEVKIPEAGRLQLASRLTALTESQIRELLTIARVPQFQSGTDDTRDVEAWMAAFKSRIGQIADAGPCPS